MPPSKKRPDPRSAPKQPQESKGPIQASGRATVALQGVSSALMAIAACVIAFAQTIDYLTEVDLLDNQATISQGITTILEQPGALAPAGPAVTTVPSSTATDLPLPAVATHTGEQTAKLDLLPSLQPEPQPAAITPPPEEAKPEPLFLDDELTPGEKVATCFEFFDEEFNVKARKLETHLHGLIKQRYRRR